MRASTRSASGPSSSTWAILHATGTVSHRASLSGVSRMTRELRDAIRSICGSARSVPKTGCGGILSSFRTTGKNRGGACRADRVTPFNVREVNDGSEEQNATTRRSLSGLSACGSMWVKLKMCRCGSETARIDGVSRPAEVIVRLFKRGVRESNEQRSPQALLGKSTVIDAVCVR